MICFRWISSPPTMGIGTSSSSGRGAHPSHANCLRVNPDARLSWGGLPAPAATLPADGTEPPGWSRYLLVRRSLTPSGKGELELAYYLCCAPAGTADEELIRVAGSRWSVEECFQTARTETGLDHYQVRRYDAWYRHITLAMLAHAYLSVTAATSPKALAAASSRSRSARSAVSWHT